MLPLLRSAAMDKVPPMQINASGRKQTWAEHHKLHNDITLFNPAPIT